MHLLILLGVVLDRFGILGGRGGRGGLSGGLGGYGFGHLLPMLFGVCGVGRMSPPGILVWVFVIERGLALVMCCCIAAISICF
jgi:hypothetical protein